MNRAYAPSMRSGIAASTCTDGRTNEELTHLDLFSHLSNARDFKPKKSSNGRKNMTQVTIIGNLTADPELRFTAQGKAVAGFTVAESKRVKDADGTWKDGDSTFWRCSLWDAAAENMTESLHKGQRVIVVGEVKQRSFETQQGEKRTVMEVTATEVGPSLKWSTAKVDKTGAPKAKPAQDDPWNASPAIGGDDSQAPF